MKQLIEGKDYSINEYMTKDKKNNTTTKTICPTCSKCKHKGQCNNRKNLYKMRICKDCKNCKDKEHCDKFYIYLKYKGEILKDARDTTGQIVRKQFNGKSREEVYKKIVDYINYINEHGYSKEQITKEDETIVSLAKKKTKSKLNSGEINPNTYGRINDTIKIIDRNKIGNIPISKVTPQMIKNFFESNRSYSNSTLNKLRSVLVNSFKYAKKQKIIKENILDDEDLLKLPKSFKNTKVVDAFSRKEEYILTKYINEHNNKYNLIILLALYTGMRIGEVLALKPEDIQFDVGKYGSIKIQRTLTKNMNGEVIVGTKTKTKNGMRVNDLTLKSRQIIEEALKRRKPNRYGLIFIRNNGKLFEDGQINSAFKRICKNAGLRLIQQKHKKTTASKGAHYVNYMSSDVNTHMLRHTFATRCIEAGVRIEVLQKLLGHSDIQTTINTYGKIYDYLSQSALTKYSNYMNETNEKFDKEFNKLEENMEKETNISYNK